MRRYVKAEAGVDHTVIYTDDSGRHFRFSGGTPAWRCNNPENLVSGHISRQNGQIGKIRIKKNIFAIFPDKKSGDDALIDSLTQVHQNESIDKLVRIYAPPKDGNNIVKYRKFLHEKTGIYSNKKIKDFTPNEFKKLWQAIEQMEGYKEGIIVEVFEITQVHKNKNGLCGYNVGGKWITKVECINLAKQGKLDVIICISQLGHEYIRARAGSSINENLSHLIVQDHHKEK